MACNPPRCIRALKQAVRPMSENRTSVRGVEGLPVFAVAAMAFFLRLAAAAPWDGQLEDPDNYLVLARSLAEGRGYVWNGQPTAYRPPLYPCLLAPMVAMLGDGEPL